MLPDLFITIGGIQESYHVTNFFKQMSDIIKGDIYTYIPIIIVSDGGSTQHALAMIEIIEEAKKKKPVLTFGLGTVCSAATLLLVSGSPTYRYASPFCEIMIHETNIEIPRMNSTCFRQWANNNSRVNERFLELLHKYTNGKVGSNINNDWFMNSEEAKRNNIIDHVGFPKFMELKIEV
jgi:ATP-dependent protease ClpP protease subunit